MITKVKVILACSAVVAAISIPIAISGGRSGNSEFSSETVDVLEPVTEPTEPELPDITNFSPEPGMTGLAKSMKQINDDLKGWIRISNTQVDYPVYQYEYDVDEGNWFYLDKDMYGNYLERGTIYMDYRDVFEGDEDKQTDNIVLYGHNMLSGSMFGDLHNYRIHEDFYPENPIIEFSSNYKDYQYVIFAYLCTSGDFGDSYYGKDWPYWDIHDLSDKKDFDDYVQTCYERSYVEPDIDVAYGDKLLTLSTCHLDEDNSRFLVIARRLRDHETIDSIDRKSGGTGNIYDILKGDSHEESDDDDE